MSYIPVTPEDIKEMTGTIGVKSIDDLFADIPGSLVLKDLLDLPGPLSDFEIESHMEQLAEKNVITDSFVGAGSYRHYIPAVVDHLASRSEFYTAYTPYQAEVSQGTLAVIFEFQTMICSLTGMDIANASMYDGATSLAEAVLMSIRDNRKNKILVSSALHPHYRDVLQTYAWAADFDIVIVNEEDGVTSIKNIEKALDDSAGALVVQSPNFFGSIEDVKALASLTAGLKMNLITVVAEPVSLGLLVPPGRNGADIVCGEAQAFGNPIGFGGPMVGFLAARESFVRKMPGRLIGKTTDLDGNEAYVLTLQTREQHIRRDRATSNICTNQGLCALRAVIYLSLIGKKLRELAVLNHKLAAYLKKGMKEAGFKPVCDKPYFNEFVVFHPKAGEIITSLKDAGINAGILLSDYYEKYENCILLCATEMNTPQSIDRFLNKVKKAV